MTTENQSFNLTKRELEIIELLSQGYSNPEIAQALSITLSTAKAHISNILNKLHAKNRVQATVILIKNNIIKI